MATTRAPQTKPAAPAAPAPTPQRPQTPTPSLRSMPSSLQTTPTVRLGGDPLPENTRTPLEATFGADLSSVRVHTDGQSAAAVNHMDANAFAYGNHIFLGDASRANDLPLMAHEVTHVLQQRSGPAVRLSSTSHPTDSYEVEANAAAAAVQRGESFQVRQQSAAQPQFDNGGGILGRVRSALAGLARNIPGYTLISFIIGRDIVAGQPVARNAVNLVGAIMGLVPGGNAMFENLQRSGALQRAFEWFTAEFARLNFTLSYFSGLFSRFIDSLGILDIIPTRLFNRLSETFGEPVRRLRDFAVNAVIKVLEFIFEAVMGAGGARILAILRRARATFELIIRDPVRFIGNLIRAIAGGFNQFKNNIVRHLQAGLIGWLTGALGGAGITLPPRFDARGILSLVLQILGLTYQNFRTRLVRLIGEPRVRLLEGAFEFIRILVTQGLAAAWQKILEFAGNLAEMVLSGIRDFVVQTIVQQAIVRLISFFNPAGAIIQAILAIYNTIQWFIQRIQQIMALVNAVVDSIANIAAGNLAAAMNYVEQTMARALPVIISFLASLLGLNRIADHVRRVIQRIQGVVNRALDRVFAFLTQRIRNFAGPGGDQDPRQRLQRGLTDGVAAVNRLSGSRIGVAVMRPVLSAIRLRHRLQVLEPVQRGNRWAVRAVANPEGEQPTNKEADVVAAPGGTAAAGIRVGDRIQLARGGGSDERRRWSQEGYDVTQVTATHLHYRGQLGSGMLQLSGENRVWRRYNLHASLWPLERILAANNRDSWGADYELARRVLNYRFHEFQLNPNNKDWEHIVEQSANGANSVENLALTDRGFNQRDLNQWFGSRQPSGEGFPSTGPLTVREYLNSINAPASERRRWKLRAYRIYRATLRFMSGPRGRYQLLDR